VRIRASIVFWAFALVVALSACSGPLFDPVGNYTGTMAAGGAASPVTIVITEVSSTSWDVALTTSSTFVGTCTHDTSVSAKNLTCVVDDGGTPATLTGDLDGNTWSGTASESGTTFATFTVTRS